VSTTKTEAANGCDITTYDGVTGPVLLISTADEVLGERRIAAVLTNDEAVRIATGLLLTVHPAGSLAEAVARMGVTE
jgi:hypothetical protein